MSDIEFSTHLGTRKLYLKEEELRLIRNMVRLEHQKFTEEYKRYSSPHLLSILTLVDNVRIKLEYRKGGSNGQN